MTVLSLTKHRGVVYLPYRMIHPYSISHAVEPNFKFDLRPPPLFCLISLKSFNYPPQPLRNLIAAVNIMKLNIQ